MPLSTKVIKQKIQSTKNIQKITKTMEMVSVSKMKKSLAKAMASRSFSHYALELLLNISKNREVRHKLMEAGKGEHEILVIIAGNKGLCGGYHANLSKALLKYKNSNGGLKAKALVVGKYAEKMVDKLGVEKLATFPDFSEKSDLKQIRNLSALLRKEYMTGQYKSAKILYTEFIKSTTYKPILREIFPVSVESMTNIADYSKESKHTSLTKLDYLNSSFEPSAEEILRSILPGLVDSVVYQAVLESFASEHSARMIAMKNAGDNATEVLDDLVLSYNQARQAGITRELSEIVAGAEALA